MLCCGHEQPHHVCSTPQMLAQPAATNALSQGSLLLDLCQVRVQAHARVAASQARSAHHELICDIEACGWRQCHAQHGVPAPHACSSIPHRMHMQKCRIAGLQLCCNMRDRVQHYRSVLSPAIVMELSNAAVHVAEAHCLILCAGVRCHAALTEAQAGCATCGVESDPNLPAPSFMSHRQSTASQAAQGLIIGGTSK